jgi:hypothetical protein
MRPDDRASADSGLRRENPPVPKVIKRAGGGHSGVDVGANLKAFARMDGAWLGSIDIAVRKARTARFFDMNTGEIGKLSQPAGSLFGIEHSNGGLITFPGGVPFGNQGGAVPMMLPQ